MIRPDSGDPVKVICGLRCASRSAAFETWINYGNPENYYDVLEENGKFYRFEADCEYGYDGETYNKSITLEEEVPVAEVKGAIQVLRATTAVTL